MSIIVKPLQEGAPNPGFQSIVKTAIASVTEALATVKVKGIAMQAQRVSFADPTGNVFAALTQPIGMESLGWIKMAAHGGKRLGHLIKADSQIKFPAKGSLSSEASTDREGKPRTVTTVRGVVPVFDAVLHDVTIDDLLVKP